MSIVSYFVRNSKWIAPQVTICIVCTSFISTGEKSDVQKSIFLGYGIYEWSLTTIHRRVIHIDVEPISVRILGKNNKSRLSNKTKRTPEVSTFFRDVGSWYKGFLKHQPFNEQYIRHSLYCVTYVGVLHSIIIKIIKRFISKMFVPGKMFIQRIFPQITCRCRRGVELRYISCLFSNNI